MFVIGFVVAMDKEYEPFLKNLGTLEKEETVCGIGFNVYNAGDRLIVLAKCGMGQSAAAAATALLIGHYGAAHIVNFGLVGSLVPELKERDIAVVHSVVHYDVDFTPFGTPKATHPDIMTPYLKADETMLEYVKSQGIPAVRLASGDKFIASTAAKNALISDFSASICDMEGAGVALTATRAKVPFTLIKTVSDSADEGSVTTYYKNKFGGLEFCIKCVVSAIFAAKN